MTFTSFEFLLFFPIVVVLYNIVPAKLRTVYLLLASYVFYALMQPVYLALLVVITLITYCFARWMASVEDDDDKHRIMTGGIVLVLLPLFFFKYFNFVNQTLQDGLALLGVVASMPQISFLLPVGISFYTFMAVGYLIDIYEEKLAAEKNLCVVGLFLSFFPIVLSGPIERAPSMFPQLKQLKRSTPEMLVKGAKLMLWGYFMKLCVADRLALYVDAVFNNYMHHNGTTMTFATLLYPLEVYADLGGYSLIAIGAALCMGIKIRPNFRRPFFATSTSELWRRWHMSLIDWLTDYIYTPLSFALRSWKMRGIITALMLTFLISGIWHGAAMTFIVWGLIQGVVLCLEAVTQKKRVVIEERYRLKHNFIYVFVCCVIVYCVFAFSQIFGLCPTMAGANETFAKIFSDPGELYIDKTTLTYAFIMVAILFFKDLRDEYFPEHFQLFESGHIVVRFITYLIVVVLILNFGVLDGSQFIYFQF